MQLIKKKFTELLINSKQANWDEFEITFKQVHKSFYENLNEKYPTLSKGERKIAAFLKLNMSLKDIAAITF